ncbi:MAG: hypothetical protein JWN46_959 [Acidimicrobiales bacterium]|nr:hypothetical protein [Acidimicrobiales bacterium]
MAVVAIDAPAVTKRRSDWLFWVSVGWMALMIFCAVFGHLLPLADPHAQLAGPPLSGPGLHHPFGTDVVGYDLFSQAVNGARISMLVAAVSVASGMLVGGTIGLVSGYLGGRTSGVLMWFIDVLLAFPALVFALALVSFVGAHLSSVVMVFAVLAVPGYARVARALTLTYATENFVMAARAAGATPVRVMLREILPNVIVPLASFAALGAAVAIIAEGSLAFLGLSAPGSISWGNMIAQGQDQLYDGPQAAIAPMVVMFLTILSLNFIGERLGAVLDPRQAQL